MEPACPDSLVLRKRIKGGRTNRCYRGVFTNTSPGKEQEEATTVPVFAKFNDNHQECILRKEADMLEFLQNHVPVPRVLHVSDHCLILEYLQMDNSNKHIPQLAKVIGSLHQATVTDRCGFHMDNFHGPIAVNNTWDTNWVTFFRNSRWNPLCKELAIRGTYSGDGHDAILALTEEVSAKMDLFFPTPPRLCLLHGDLHHGNWGYCAAASASASSCGTSGLPSSVPEPADNKGNRDGNGDDGRETAGAVYVFDPLPLYGHNEFDLASLDCFVMPKDAFLEVYHRYMPREEVMFAERRMLYHSFFRLIGFLLTGDEEHLLKAHGYLTTLALTTGTN